MHELHGLARVQPRASDLRESSLVYPSTTFKPSIDSIEQSNWRSFGQAPIKGASKVAGEDERRSITMTLHLNTSSGAERIDEDTREGEIARRNVLFGLWAGRHAGLEGDALEAYALAVHLADHRSPGHDDVIAKVAADLARRGKPVSDRRLRTCLREMALRASL